MKMKITILGSERREVQNVVEINVEGDLTNGVTDTIRMYHQAYPDAPLFDKTIKVDRA